MVDVNERKLAQEFVGLLKKYKDERHKHEERWREQAEYLLPNREILIKGTDHKGMTTHDNVYDGIGNHVLQVWADGILGYMASPVYKWNRYRIRRIPNLPDLNDIPEIKRFLQEYEEAMYDEFKSSTGNIGGFYQALGTFLRDGGSIGNAYCLPLEHSKKRKVVYHVFHPIEMCIGVNEDGEVDIALREYKIPVRNALKYFDKSKLDPKWIDLAEKKPMEEVEILWVVIPREERVAGLKSAKNMPYASYYVDVRGSRILSESGFEDFPLAAYRCMLDSGETYGRCPGSNALKDIKMANKMSKANLIGAQKLVDPAIELPIEARGMINLNPGGRYWRDTGMPPGQIQAINQGIQVPFAVDQLERIEERVKRHFFYDFFLSLLLAEKQMTAFEVAQKMGEKATVLAPIIYRFIGDALDTMIYRTAMIAQKAGRLPTPPDVLFEMGATEVDVEYLGPLYQAQRMLFKTHGIMSFLETVGQAAQYWPESVTDRIDGDELVEDLANAHGMPEKDMRSDEEVKQIRAQRAKVQQAMQQAEMAKVGADAGKAMSTAPQPGSPMEALMGAGGVVPGGAG